MDDMLGPLVMGSGPWLAPGGVCGGGRPPRGAGTSRTGATIEESRLCLGKNAEIRYQWEGRMHVAHAEDTDWCRRLP